MSETPKANAESSHRHAQVARPGDHPGQVGRFGNVTRMVIHPTEADPTAPNAGTICERSEPGDAADSGSLLGICSVRFEWLRVVFVRWPGAAPDGRRR